MPDYLINDRAYSVLTSNNEVSDLQKGKNTLFELNYLSVIDVSGERAAEFLQGQLTCDVRKVSDCFMQQGALCNLKGRIQALFDVIKWQGYQLILPRDLVADTLAVLAKTSLVSRVTLKENDQYKVYGLFIGDNSDLKPHFIDQFLESNQLAHRDGFCWYALSSHHYIILAPQGKASSLTATFAEKQQLLGSLAWHRLQLENLNMEIYPVTRGLFLPHRLDLPNKGYVSFDKGCYKGQEIIARMHYRAKTKHGLKKFTVRTVEKLEVGQIFVDEAGMEVGELIDFCPLAESDYLILLSILHEHPGEVFIKDRQVSLMLEGKASL